MPKGYILAEFEVTDAAAWANYVPLAQSSLAAFGARYVVRGGDAELLEGQATGRRLSIIEFDSREKASEWYHSQQYHAAKAARRSAAKVNVVLLSGPEP